MKWLDNCKYKISTIFGVSKELNDGSIEIDERRLMTLGFAAAITASVVASGIAHAIAVPAVGSFAYDIYDVGVNDILKGPIGFIGGMLGIIFGATQIMKSWLIGILCILAGTIAIKADSITTSLGMVM